MRYRLMVDVDLYDGDDVDDAEVLDQIGLLMADQAERYGVAAVDAAHYTDSRRMVPVPEGGWRYADEEDYVRTLERLDEDRERLLAALPPCGAHGSGCVPHALDWIREARTVLDNVEPNLDPRAEAVAAVLREALPDVPVHTHQIAPR